MTLLLAFGSLIGSSVAAYNLIIGGILLYKIV